MLGRTLSFFFWAWLPARPEARRPSSIKWERAEALRKVSLIKVRENFWKDQEGSISEGANGEFVEAFLKELEIGKGGGGLEGGGDDFKALGRKERSLE